MGSSVAPAALFRLRDRVLDRAPDPDSIHRDLYDSQCDELIGGDGQSVETISHINWCDDGFAKGVVWPLFHYQIDRVPLAATGWEAYQQVTPRFWTQSFASIGPSDVIWVHDDHLMLVPAALRQQLAAAKMGFSSIRRFRRLRSSAC